MRGLAIYNQTVDIPSMDFKRHYLIGSHFMFTKLPSVVNDENLKAHVQRLNEETQGITDLKEFADCLDVIDISRLTVQGTVQSASSEIDRPYSKLAILVPDSQLIYGYARAYQMFSEDKRQAVQIFKDPDTALDWLARDENEKTIFGDFVTMHSNAVEKLEREVKT